MEGKKGLNFKMSGWKETVGVVIFLLMLLYFLGVFDSKIEKTSSKNDPVLELLSWSMQHEGNFMTVQGEVRNISDESLSYVAVVVSFYTASNRFVSSETMVIEYNPIMSMQTSPFKVMTTYNPAMDHVTISFKEFIGSRQYVHIDKSQKM